MKFAIPLKREDLAHAPENEWEYYVREVFSIRELKTKMKDCELSAKQTGPDFILKGGFDILYSVLANFHRELSPECKESAFNILRGAMVKLEKELDNALADGQQYLSASEKQTYLNKLKMIVYLFCQTIELLESNDAALGGADALFTKGGKKGAKSSSTATVQWEPETKLDAVTRLYRLLHINISSLFDPPVVEREFVNVLASCLFRLLESPSIALQRCKDLRQSIIQVLGTLNHRFGYSLSCRLKIVQSLRHFEHLALAMSEAVDVFARDYGGQSLIMEIVRDLSQIDAQELSRDTSATRAYATFLGDLAERQPERMKPCLSLLMAHLEGDSSSMRKCVLSILGEIVLRVLGSSGGEVELDDAAKDSRDQFLDCLEDHVHDVHAHVRTAVLQIWGKLCVAKTIPLARQQRLLKLVIGRLQDKSSNVRKQAVQLLTTLLQCNPYTASMPVEDLAAQLGQELEKLDAMVPQTEKIEREKREKREKEWAEFEAKVLHEEEDEEEDEGGESVWENAARDEIIARLRHLLQKRKFRQVRSLLRSAREHFPEDDLLGEDLKEEQLGILKAIYITGDVAVAVEEKEGAEEDGGKKEDEVSKQKVLVSYLQDCVQFADELNKALPTVGKLLGSKQITDVLEAVNFFVSAFEFGVLKAMDGVRQMLSLIWSRETVVKEAVVAAYKRLYVDGGEVAGGEKARAAYIIKNFVALVSGATIGELTSLEELICMLVETKDVGKECFQVAWQYFTRCHESTTEMDSRSALVLLGMIGSAEPAVITSNLALLVKTALKREERDSLVIHDACVAIGKIGGGPKAKGGVVEEEAALKFETDHEIFTCLEEILVEGMLDTAKEFYIPMSQKACSVIYQFSEQPDVLCGRILKEVCRRAMQSPSSIVTKRLISFVGHIAVAQLNHLDVSVLGELKRRKGLRDQRKEEQQLKKRKGKGKRVSSVGAATNGKDHRRRQSKATAGSSAAEEDDMEMIGAEADDTELEFIHGVCENEVLGCENLLSAFVPLITHICLHPAKYPDPQLRAASSLALAKLMLISSRFCEDHLQLLFTMMEKSDDPVIRANLIIASGDLAFRFPNTLEPWTPHMYGRLRDPSTLVRSNTLTVLTHLILNDMIKVKGQISDMALCVSDDNDKISGLSKHFFSELARKGNALYNVMPDIISRLSSTESDVPEEQFRFVMGYIISLIEKDKHLESLVEKLCHRFRAAQSERQWRDLAYCLSLFTFSDKAVKKLHDNFSCYSDKLHDEEVFDALTGILVQARKLAKTEARTEIDELEDMLGKAHEKCMEDHQTNTRAKGAKKQQPARKEEDEGEEGEEKKGEEEEEATERTERKRNGKKSAKTPAKTPGDRKQRMKRTRRVQDSDDDEGEESSEERIVTPATTQSTRSSRRRK